MLKTISADDRANMPREHQHAYDTLVESTEVDLWTTQRSLAWAVYGHFGARETRYTRAIVRDLRVQFGVPVLSGVNGYKIATNTDELRDFCGGLEAKARAAAASYFETYRAMEDLLPAHEQTFFGFAKREIPTGDRARKNLIKATNHI